MQEGGARALYRSRLFKCLLALQMDDGQWHIKIMALFTEQVCQDCFIKGILTSFKSLNPFLP